VRRLPWLSILLVLPWTAWAGDAGMPQAPVPPDLTAAVARAETAADFEPEINLTVDPSWSALQDMRPVLPLAKPSRAKHDVQGPLSFGFAVRTRRAIGDEARQTHDEQTGLGEQVEGMVRRATFGVKGTYRF
jgi:hypothetical protein